MVRILLIEDDVAQLKRVSEIISKAFPHSEIYSAAGVIDATKKIEELQAVSLVVSDYLLADGTGYDLLKYCQDHLTKTLRLVKELQRIIKNVSPRRPSQYYLPGKDDPAQGFLVDFSFILSIPYDKLKEETTLFRLKSPWREQLLNRYVNYSSRVGTLDYSNESVCKAIKAFYPELTEGQILNKMKQ